MSKPYDATLKQLLDAFAADWIGLLAPPFGLPPTVGVEPLDVDLSTVQMSADKVFRLRPPAAGLLHVEPQTSWDGEFADRLLEYNVLLHRRYGGPVYTVAVLLRPEANATAVDGTLVRRYPDGREYLRFEYGLVRVWTLPVEPLLTGGIGALPLALLTDEARDRLGEYVNRVDARLRDERAPDPTRQLILTSSYILLGMRYNDGEIEPAFARVQGMLETSTTYQAILRKGRQEGQLETAREMLLDLLRSRFPDVSHEVEERIAAATDVAKLRAAVLQVSQIATPDELQL